MGTISRKIAVTLNRKFIVEEKISLVFKVIKSVLKILKDQG